MATINFLFNWFYNDERDIAYLQSGWFPLRARGTDPSLPDAGARARFDWRSFNAGAAITSARASFRQLPKDLNPRRGYIVSWNNKQAPGWRAADDSSASTPCTAPSGSRTGCGPRSRARARSTCRGWCRSWATPAPSTCAAQEVYPWLRRVIGRPRDADERAAVGHARRLGRRGAPTASIATATTPTRTRGAVALMDAWWDAARARHLRAGARQGPRRARARARCPSTSRPARAAAPTSTAGTATWRRTCALCSAGRCAGATRAATAAAGRCARAAASRKRRRRRCAAAARSSCAR